MMSKYLNNNILMQKRQRLALLFYCCCLYIYGYNCCLQTNCEYVFADAYHILPQQSKILSRATTTTRNLELRIRSKISERTMKLKQHGHDIIQQQQQYNQQEHQRYQHVESIIKQSSYNNKGRRDIIQDCLLTFSTITYTTFLTHQLPCWADDETNDIPATAATDAITATKTTTTAATPATTTTTKNIPRTVTIEPLVPAIYIRNQLRLAQRLCNEWITAIITGKTVTDVSQKEDIKNKYITQLRTLFDPPPMSNDKVFTISRPTIITSQESIQRYNNAKNYVETKFTYDCSKILSKSTGTTAIPLNGLLIRYSCNVYTANIRYGETYILTADPIVKKQLIRSDALPDITTVITSDLDLRDLYRNQLQTIIDDIQAELYIPMSTNSNNNSNGPDPIEVNELLTNAIQTLDKWLALVPIDDINKGNEVLDQLYTSIQTTCRNTNTESSKNNNNKNSKKNNSIRLLQLPYPY